MVSQYSVTNPMGKEAQTGPDKHIPFTFSSRLQRTFWRISPYEQPEMSLQFEVDQSSTIAVIPFNKDLLPIHISAKNYSLVGILFKYCDCFACLINCS